MSEDQSISLITRLKASIDSFSPSERRIADEITQNPSSISNLSSQEFAKSCQVSQSSIVKFCQKLGYKGYPALKLALNAELARGENHQQIHRNIFSDDPTGAVAQKLYESKLSALSETLILNNSETLEAAVDRIHAAKRITLMGVGGSALVCDDFAAKLTKFGKAVIAGTDSHIHLGNLASFNEDDLLIAISYSGMSKEVGVSLDFAKEHNIPIITLFGYRSERNNIDGAIQLSCVADENLIRASSIATRTAQLMITDLLFVLFTQRLENVPDTIGKASGIVRNLL